ncbi:MAG TPA: glycine--tRNA ligase [Candidatus Sulfomarinibacteraceae bacterium]|nr:glycine--tRNA ligase [Candidatus Sulfomarinibacteraceae bacterium]
MSEQPSLETITALAKRRGFVYPTSEIYGGLASSYDYGPLGAELLRNIRNLWWEEMITTRPDMVGMDSQILLHPQTWVASGHVDAFHDPLVEDKVSHRRYRADHLIEAWLAENPEEAAGPVTAEPVEAWSIEEMAVFIQRHGIRSPEGNELTAPRSFNIMFETAIGAVAGEKSRVYLRGETAQGIFTNFKQVLDSTRLTLPFGIGQIGKSFRNEITTGQFVFRTLEFEQAEIEYFFDPEQSDWQALFKAWQDDMWRFVVDTLGVREENLRWRRHGDRERSHYSRETYDLDYNFPFGYKELWGLAYRSDFDLRQHMEHAGAKLEYTDPYSNKRFVPHVIEPAAGINRFFLMLLCDAYWEDKENERTVLRFKPSLAPYKVAIFPLLKNKPPLVQKAREVFRCLSPHMATAWDERGNIGKRYYYQDEIGTPFCVTVDFDTLQDDTVTVRDRDTTEQVRVAVGELRTYLEGEIGD